MITKVFLDLEETIIDSWGNPVLMNIDRIRETLNTFGVDEIGIFSFAIWHDKDKSEFVERGIDVAIEKALNVKLVWTLTIPEIKKAICDQTRLHMDVTDFVTTFGKQMAFINWVLATHKKEKQETMVVLIDDVVKNLTVIDHDNNVTIRLINVNNI